MFSVPPRPPSRACSLPSPLCLVAFPCTRCVGGKKNNNDNDNGCMDQSCQGQPRPAAGEGGVFDDAAAARGGGDNVRACMKTTLSSFLFSFCVCSTAFRRLWSLHLSSIFLFTPLFSVPTVCVFMAPPAPPKKQGLSRLHIKNPPLWAGGPHSPPLPTPSSANFHGLSGLERAAVLADSLCSRSHRGHRPQPNGGLPGFDLRPGWQPRVGHAQPFRCVPQARRVTVWAALGAPRQAGD